MCFVRKKDSTSDETITILDTDQHGRIFDMDLRKAFIITFKTLWFKRIFSFLYKIPQKVYDFLYKYKILKVIPLATLSLLSLVIIAILIDSYLEANTNVVIIEPFDVPDCIVQKGYSGKAIAATLIDNLNLIKLKVKDPASDPIIVASKNLNKEPTIEVSGTRIPINYLYDLTRKHVGKQKQFISGEIFILDPEAEKIRLQLRVTGKVSITFDKTLSELDNIMFMAAEYISKHIQPFVLANYYTWHDDYDKARNRDYLYRDMLGSENIKNNKDKKAFVYYLWGAYYLRQRCLEKAIEKYNKALKYKPIYAAPLIGLGDVSQSEEKFKESIFYYKKIITELDHKNPRAYRRWGDALCGLKKYSEALKKYEMAVSYDPEAIHAFTNWGNALFEQSKYDEAMKKYEMAVDIDPESYYSLSKMGNILLKKKKYDAAMKKFDKALDINPDYKEALDGKRLASSFLTD